MPSLPFILSSFSTERAIMLLSTQPSDEINSNCFKPACGGKVAHFENDTASE